MMASLTSIATNGIINANARFENIAPPNNAIAAIGAKLGGCGSNRLMIANAISTATMAFCRFSMIVLIYDINSAKYGNELEAETRTSLIFAV
jgi:hypothetical protein